MKATRLTGVYYFTASEDLKGMPEAVVGDKNKVKEHRGGAYE